MKPGDPSIWPALRNLWLQHRDRFRRMLAPLLQKPAPSWGYAGMLALEEGLRWKGSGVIGVSVSQSLETAGITDTGPFNALSFRIHEETGEPHWRRRFLQMALRPLPGEAGPSDLPWRHPRGRFGAGTAVLIDSFQEEVSRVAKLAHWVRLGKVAVPGWPDPEAMEKLVAGQWILHRRLLRDPGSGLWHNGLGWLEGDPEALSPGFWSRGHGWLLRGLTEALEHLGPGEVRGELVEVLRELTRSLQAARPAGSIWPALLGLSPGRSPPESSGSAMIAAAWVRGLQAGVLEEGAVGESLLEVVQVLLRDFLTEDGTVLGACPGPGPLVAEGAYLMPARFPVHEAHGVAGFSILAASLSLTESG